MIAIRPPLVAETPRSKEMIKLWVIFDQAAGKDRHIPGRRNLAAIGQAGGVSEPSISHAEGFRFRSHHFCETDLCLADRFRDDNGNVVGRFCDVCEQPSSMLGKAAS